MGLGATPLGVWEILAERREVWNEMGGGGG